MWGYRIFEAEVFEYSGRKNALCLVLEPECFIYKFQRDSEGKSRGSMQESNCKVSVY